MTMRDSAPKINARLRQRRAELYDNLPELKAIDAQMAHIGREISEAILNHPENTEALLHELKATLDALKTEKAVLLTDHGISPKYLELSFNCEKCKDTGYLEDNTRCSCLNQRLISAAYKMYNIEKLLEKQNFDHFDLNVFSTEILPKRTFDTARKHENNPRGCRRIRPRLS